MLITAFLFQHPPRPPSPLPELPAPPLNEPHAHFAFGPQQSVITSMLPTRIPASTSLNSISSFLSCAGFNPAAFSAFITSVVTPFEGLNAVNTLPALYLTVCTLQSLICGNPLSLPAYAPSVQSPAAFPVVSRIALPVIGLLQLVSGFHPHVPLVPVALAITSTT